MIKGWLSLLLLWLINSYSLPLVEAQNLPFRLSPHQAELQKQAQNSDSTFTVEKDSLLYRTAISSVLHNVVLFNPQLQGHLPFQDCRYTLPFKLVIQNCYFQDYEDFPAPKDCPGKNLQLEVIQGFSVVDNTFSKELSVRNVRSVSLSGAAFINNNKAKALYVDATELNLLNLMQNQVDNSINVSYTKGKSALVSFNKFSQKDSQLSIDYSKFSIGCSILENFAKRTILDTDSINNMLTIMLTNSAGDTSIKKEPRTVVIKNSFINAQCQFFVEDSLGSSTFIFENCSFGRRASLFNLKIDTLIFRNCTDIPYPLFLTCGADKNVMCLELINSNVNNLRFDYTDKFKLFFADDITEETKNNTYQSLLAKYKAEGKPENIEKIDIEYKRYEYRKNILMYPVWLLDYIWWRYGHAKWLIVVWTFVFLGIFFVYNYKNWEGMRNIYSVFTKDDLGVDGNKQGELKAKHKGVYVLLYTSFIFFSLRVDFEKLKYAQKKYLLVFFAQYLVGLICLFFLANAIFKIG